MYVYNCLFVCLCALVLVSIYLMRVYSTCMCDSGKETSYRNLGTCQDSLFYTQYKEQFVPFGASWCMACTCTCAHILTYTLHCMK